MNTQLELLLSRYPILNECRDSIEQAFGIMKQTYMQSGKILVCGNGGSCADAEHIVGELMKGFCKKRPLSDVLKKRLLEINHEDGELLASLLEEGLPAIALSAHTALNTAYANDKNPDLVFAQEVMGYGLPQDTFLGISTSGNSKNVFYAMQVAKAKGLKTIALTGKDGGKIAKIAEVAIIVPSNETYQIQELHLPVYHALCLMLEEEFFKE